MTRKKTPRADGWSVTQGTYTTYSRPRLAFEPGGPGKRPRRTVRVGSRALTLIWVGGKSPDGYGFTVLDGDAWLGTVAPLHHITRHGPPYPNTVTCRRVWQAMTRGETYHHFPLAHDWPPLHKGTLHPTQHDALLRLLATAAVASATRDS